MGAYEIIKDAILIAQKADNAPLVQALFDAQQQALDLQEENAKLKEQVKELLDNKRLEKKIIRHERTIVTLKGDKQAIRYCSACWDRGRKLIQMRIMTVYGADTSTLEYPVCSSTSPNKLSSNR